MYQRHSPYFSVRDELCPWTFPLFLARLTIGNANVQKAVDVIRVGDAER